MTRTSETVEERTAGIVLRESEERLLRIIREAPFGAHMYRLEPDGRLIFIGANDAADRILHVDNRKFIGKTIEEAFPALSAVGIPEAYRRVAATGQPFEQEQVTYGEHGISGAFDIFAFQTAPGCMAVFFNDITERKRAEDALRESERRLNAFIDSAPLPLDIFDEDFRYLKVNPASAKAIGRPVDEIVGKTIREIAPELFEKLKGPFCRALAGEPQLDREVSGRMPDGRTAYFRFSYVPVTLPGKKRGVGLVSSDITEQKQASARLETAVHLAEQRAREAEEGKRTLDTLMQNIPEGILIVEAPEGKVRRISRYGREFLGFKRGEAMGMELRQLLDRLEIASEGSKITGKSQILNVLSGGTPVMNREYAITAAGGGRAVTLTNAGPIRDKEGRITGAVITWQDITERKKDQERIRQGYERLEMITNGIIASISRVVEMRDPYTAGHQRRVGQLAFAMAKELGLGADQANGIRIAGLIHDIGKLNVPAEILSKPGRLSVTEFEIIKIHPQAGYDILRVIDFPWPVAEVAYQHQERLNGSGYPRQLKGDEILPETKVVSVADTVEAMTFPRPYRPRIGLERALAEIETHRGTLFDPAAVDACLKLFREKNFTFEK